MGVRTLLSAVQNRFDGLRSEIWEEANSRLKWYCNGLDHAGEHLELLGWDDLRFPAQGINPAGAVNAPSVDTTVFPGTLLFSSSQTNLIAGVAQMPHAWANGTEVHPHIHWAKTTSASGAVAWEFSYVVCDIGGVIGAYSSFAEGAEAASTSDTANKQGIYQWAPISMVGAKPSVMLLWQIRRNTSAGDTYGATARLLEFDIHYQANKFGSTSEF